MKKPIVSLRLALYGCRNRPFFYIVATHRLKARNRGYFEQIGTYDPMPNSRNEKLIAFNMDRVRYWLSVGARPSRPVAILLSLAGFLPPHPYAIRLSKRNCEALEAGTLTSDLTEEAEYDVKASTDA